MALRGKVLRDTNNSNGLISAGGKQFEFTLEHNWKSDTSPKIGMVVEFELDSNEKIQSIFAVNENKLAKEQADLALRVAKEKGHAFLKEASARLGTSVLIAWAALAFSWFFLNLISVSITSTTSIGFTFWDSLGIVNNSISLANAGYGNTGDKGIYSLLAITALVGPGASQFWKHPLAHLGSSFPLVLMLLVFGLTYQSMHNVAAQAQQQAQQVAAAFENPAVTNMVSGMMSEMMKAVHIGVGGIVSFLASIFLAFVGLKQYLIAKAQY